MAPLGLCQEAFHTVYPESLALLYSGDFAGSNSRKVNCPRPGGGIVFEVKRVKKRGLIRRGELALRKLLSKVYPVEVLNYDIKISPVAVKGDCPKDMRVNSEYDLNLYSNKELCPAACDSLFPFILPFSFISGDGIRKMGPGSFVCPDHKTNIVFQLLRADAKLQTSQNSKEVEFPGCLSFQNIQLRTGAGAKLSFCLKECLPAGLCYSLFHNVYPYYLTLLHKGYFGWMKDKSSIIAQCPDPDRRVVVEIKRIQADQIRLSVIDRKRECPKKMALGDTFLLRQEDYKLPFRLLRDISPYVNMVNLGIAKKARCSSAGDDGKDSIDIEVTSLANS
jgi:uncharacterized repeat protein (TIGR04076 family)